MKLSEKLRKDFGTYYNGSKMELIVKEAEKLEQADKKLRVKLGKLRNDLSISRAMDNGYSACSSYVCDVLDEMLDDD